MNYSYQRLLPQTTGYIITGYDIKLYCKLTESNIIYNDILWLGLSLRTEEAIVWLIEYQISPQLRFGFSHDFPFTEIARYSVGTNEILIRYEFAYKTNATGVKFF